MQLIPLVAAAVLALVQADPARPLSYAEYRLESARAAQDATVGAMKPLILSGTEVPVGTKAFVSGMRATANGTDFCGGSLITPTHVLTAAHCYGDIKYVSIGTHYVSGSNDGEQIEVIKQTIHPKRQDQSNGYDFLVLELAHASKYPPVALAHADDSDIQVGSLGTVMGWGATTEGGKKSNVLLAVDVPFLDNEVCKKKLQIDNTMVCAGGEKDKDSCQGDSGGPLIVSKNGTDVLVGVVSWGEGCGRLDYPGVYARVSVARDWINDVAPMWR